MEVIVIAMMDNTMDHTFESANRIYGVGGVSPTIPTSCGGGHTPKILEMRWEDAANKRLFNKDGQNRDGKETTKKI